MAFLTTIKDPIWAWLGVAGGVAPSVLKSETLAAAHTSIGFVTMRCLGEAKKLPWSLGVGDVDSNLASLLEGPVPHEPVAAKVHQL
eukprot:12765773-Alexandrium_andersonii.AAC.1